MIIRKQSETTIHQDLVNGLKYTLHQVRKVLPLRRLPTSVLHLGNCIFKDKVIANEWLRFRLMKKDAIVTNLLVLGFADNEENKHPD